MKDLALARGSEKKKKRIIGRRSEDKLNLYLQIHTYFTYTSWACLVSSDMEGDEKFCAGWLPSTSDLHFIGILSNVYFLPLTNKQSPTINDLVPSVSPAFSSAGIKIVLRLSRTLWGGSSAIFTVEPLRLERCRQARSLSGSACETSNDRSWFGQVSRSFFPSKAVGTTKHNWICFSFLQFQISHQGVLDKLQAIFSLSFGNAVKCKTPTPAVLTLPDKLVLLPVLFVFAFPDPFLRFILLILSKFNGGFKIFHFRGKRGNLV